MSGQQGAPDTEIFLFCAGIVLVFMIIPALYAANAGTANAILLCVAKWEISPFTAFSQEAGADWRLLDGLDPETLSWPQMEGILVHAGRWGRWPMLCLIGVLAFAAGCMGRTGGLNRSFNMRTLLANNAESFACLRPVVGRGEYLLSPESRDSGPWRVARSPIQFAAENSLLVGADGAAIPPSDLLRNGLGHANMPAFGKARLDRDRARAVLEEQLGAPFSGAGDLPPLRKALAAAFAAYADGAKQDAVNLLDDLSRSYEEDDRGPRCPILEDGAFMGRVTAMLDGHGRVLREQDLERHSGYVLPWFMALLTRARRKGVLASAQFLFLRPLDRPLWYALNECGGRTAWPEASAPWAHHMAEERAGTALGKPRVAAAIRGLERALEEQGWLLKDEDASGGAPAASPSAEPDGESAPVESGGAPMLSKDGDAPSPADDPADWVVVGHDEEEEDDPALREEMI